MNIEKQTKVIISTDELEDILKTYFSKSYDIQIDSVSFENEYGENINTLCSVVVVGINKDVLI